MLIVARWCATKGTIWGPERQGSFAPELERGRFDDWNWHRLHGCEAARCDKLIGDEAAVDLGLNPHPISWTAFAAKRKVYRLIPTSAAILLVPTYFTLRVRSSLSTGNRLLGYRVGQSVGPVQQAVPRPCLLARARWHSPGLYGEAHWVDLIPRISRGRCRSCVFATDRVPTVTCHFCTTWFAAIRSCQPSKLANARRP